MKAQDAIPVVVRAVEQLTPLIREFHLEHADGELLPAFSGGCHVVVTMRAGARTFRNPYSLTGSPWERSHYRIAVRRDDQGRGGSLHMHSAVHPGSRLELSTPFNLFPVAKTGLRHLFFAGGVGITPIAAMIEEVTRLGRPFELHYGVRSPEHATLGERLRARHGEAVHLYYDDRGPALDARALLAARPLGTHAYVCGPRGMIDLVLGAGRELGWPESHLHSEQFTPAPPGEAFVVHTARSGRRVEVPGDRTLLEALEDAGIDVRYSCRGGACGQCETEVLELDGELLHHDHFLSAESRASGRRIMPCVSRARCRHLVLDL